MISLKKSHPKVCLVLGARGFIGSHLTDALLATGASVRAFDRPGIKSVKGVQADLRPGLSIVDGDLVSTRDLEAAMEGVDTCYHLISTTLPKSSNLDPAYDIETNLLGTLRMLDAAVRQKVRRIIFTSSGGTVYGTPQQVMIAESHPTEPLCSYGIMKLAIEKYLTLYQHLHGIEGVVFRLANPYGERQRIESSQGAVAVFLGKALRDEPIEVWGDGTVVRDYLHIFDVVRALLCPLDAPVCATRSATVPIYNIGSGHGVSINELITSISRVTGVRLSVNHLPGRDFDVPVNVLDIHRASTQLGWQPQITLLDGLQKTWQWMQQEYGVNRK